jgi:hypothetical protein
MKNEWSKRIHVLRATFGENLAFPWLKKQFVVYRAPDERHPIDFLCAGCEAQQPDQWLIFGVDVKTKPARTFYPDTGIDLKCYQEYKALKLPIRLIFVDENECAMYYGDLDELEEERVVEHLLDKLRYPLTQNGIIYFPRAAMHLIRALTTAECDYLRKLNTAKPDYRPEGSQLPILNGPDARL